jgi:hypothetical protein
MTIAFLLFRFTLYAGRRFFLEVEAAGRTRLNTRLPHGSHGKCGKGMLKKQRQHCCTASLAEFTPSVHCAACILLRLAIANGVANVSFLLASQLWQFSAH